MTSSSFTQIVDLIAGAEKMDMVLPILEKWGLKPLERKPLALGFDQRPYVHVEAELPPDWRQVGLGVHFSDIVDQNGSRRANLHHDPGEAHRSARSHYNILLAYRFELAASPSNNDEALLKDNKTGQSITLSRSKEFEPLSDAGYLECALGEKYGLDTSRPRVHSSIALAPLWDDAVNLEPYDIYDIYARMMFMKRQHKAPGNHLS